MIENAKKFGVSVPGSKTESPEQLFKVENLKYTISGIFFQYVQGAIFGASLSIILGFLLGKDQTASEEVA